jgi:hypothetical protein
VLRLLVVLACAMVAISAAAQDVLHPPPPLPRAAMAPPPPRLTPGDELLLQTYRAQLQTRQRQLEDRAGPTDPMAGIEALRNQQRLNRLDLDRARR